MSSDILSRSFSRIGARLRRRVAERTSSPTGVSIDIGRDEGGEYFDIAANPAGMPELSVLDVQPRMRHLLLRSSSLRWSHQFLCGHDERHWFVAAVPELGRVSTVRSALTALKPVEIRQLEDRLGVRPGKRNLRRNEAFVRQGEWFFVAARDICPDDAEILFDEPLQRSGGKPHFCEELVRHGGEVVYTSAAHPNGLRLREHARLLKRRPEMRKWEWTVRRRNPLVYVRGRVRHPDHQTIKLSGWHRVFMNTENEAEAKRHLVFFD